MLEVFKVNFLYSIYSINWLKFWYFTFFVFSHLIKINLSFFVINENSKGYVEKKVLKFYFTPYKNIPLRKNYKNVIK
jgi:hypothetical protein